MEPALHVDEMISAFRKRDAKKLRKLNDSLLREASLSQSERLYCFAVISYVLFKILSKPRFLEKKYAERLEKIEEIMKKTHLCPATCPSIVQCPLLIEFENAIKNLEADDPRFVIDIYSKARLKVAATLYAQGISLGRASEITGMEKQEILSYAGHTMMFDRVKEEKTVQDRLKALKEIAEG